MTDERTTDGPAGGDPIGAAINEKAKRMMIGILAGCGVDVTKFDVQRLETDPAELNSLMSSVWAMYARAASVLNEWRRELEEREQTYEATYARAYFVACEMLPPKATEGAKKIWVLLEAPEVERAAAKVREVNYLVNMHKAARKALEIRCDMLQSINKLAIAEWDRVHVHLNKGDQT